MIRFDVVNIGHKYVAPPAIGITVYCNFDTAFTLKECRYGSMQEEINKHVRFGKNGSTYIRAKGIKLLSRGEAEEFCIVGVTPRKCGVYKIEIAAFSDNGAAYRGEACVSVTDADWL